MFKLSQEDNAVLENELSKCEITTKEYSNEIRTKKDCGSNCSGHCGSTCQAACKSTCSALF